ncbi:MAG TPA: hypothetical protein DIT01_17495 [Lentisphaeria bacterium]|jgi:hypothetical protein|nr:hypothetical protein [Lentisphaeria bacterium]|tara:strand:+ start:6686 stop:6925 length:240 start_codon:yes stop_codon:yes gene_type:complete
MPKSEFTTVYAGRPIDTQILKTVLEAAGLNVFLKDEIMGTMVKGAQAVEVVIPTDEVEQAIPIVQQFIQEAASPVEDDS